MRWRMRVQRGICMKRCDRKSVVFVLAVVFLFLAGCDDGGGGSPPPPAVPGVCETAFQTEDADLALAARQRVGDPAPVSLSSCRMDANKNVTIGGANGCGPNVVVDKDFTGANRLGKITIDAGGKLVFPDLNDPELKTPKTLDIETTGILINDGGMFSVGTAACPIGYHEGAHVTITFTGDRDMSCDPVKGCDDGSVKGIEVKSGGILRLYGAKGVPNPHPDAGAPGVSWTALSATAGSQSQTLHLADDVTKGQRPWAEGDWMVVGTSSFSPFESEFVRIKGAPTSDGAGGSIVMIEKPLQYSHFGSQAPTASQTCTVSETEKTVACGSVAGCTAP